MLDVVDTMAPSVKSSLTPAYLWTIITERIPSVDTSGTKTSNTDARTFDVFLES